MVFDSDVHVPIWMKNVLFPLDVIWLAADGRVLLAPSPDVRDGRIAIVVDPLGAAVGLVEWDEPGLAEVMP